MNIVEFMIKADELRRKEGDLYQETYELYIRSKSEVPEEYSKLLDTIHDHQLKTLEALNFLRSRIYHQQP